MEEKGDKGEGEVLVEKIVVQVEKKKQDSLAEVSAVFF